MSDLAAKAPSGDLFHLIYRSRSLLPEGSRKPELGALFGVARSNNKRLRLTGALLCVDDCFVQVLEGAEPTVRELFARISGDPRHDLVTLVDSGPLTERVFSRWAMAKVADDGEPDIPLIAHRDGIAPAAGRRTTEQQDRVLDVMRRAARGEAHHA